MLKKKTEWSVHPWQSAFKMWMDKRQYTLCDASIILIAIWIMTRYIKHVHNHKLRALEHTKTINTIIKMQNFVFSFASVECDWLSCWSEWYHRRRRQSVRYWNSLLLFLAFFLSFVICLFVFCSELKPIALTLNRFNNIFSKYVRNNIRT